MNTSLTVIAAVLDTITLVAIIGTCVLIAINFAVCLRWQRTMMSRVDAVEQRMTDLDNARHADLSNTEESA